MAAAEAGQNPKRSSLTDFVLRGKLGSGTYGVVWKCVRKQDKVTYALKEIGLQTLSRKEQEECLNEVHVLATLKNKYIVKYYDCFIEQGKLYIVTEYASGGTLHDYINRHRGDGQQGLPEDTIWRLVLQMLLALHHMHSRRILHRDVKSLNVFLDADLNVKMGDLGVARVLSTHSQFAQTVVGTPYYLSPELCNDEPYDAKSDVWALGVVAFECCTGQHPFDADNQGALILKILRGRHRPVPSTYSAELQELINRCLTQRAAARPNTTTLLGCESVRRRAAEYGLELPAVAAGAAPRQLSAVSPSAAGPPSPAGVGSPRSGRARPAAGAGRKAGGSGGGGKTAVGSPAASPKPKSAGAMRGAGGAETERVAAAGGGVEPFEFGGSDGRSVSGPLPTGASKSDSGGRRDAAKQEGVDSRLTAAEAEKMKEAVEILKQACVDLVGGSTFDRLYQVVQEHWEEPEQGADGQRGSIASLSRQIFKIIPTEKAEAVTLLYKIMYQQDRIRQALPC